MRAESKETLRRFALNDERLRGVGTRDGTRQHRAPPGSTRRRTPCVRLGASMAIEAAASSYQPNIEMALAAGASVDEIVGTLVAVAPDVGVVRAVSAAPELALALGYDVYAAFESLDEDLE